VLFLKSFLQFYHRCSSPLPEVSVPPGDGFPLDKTIRFGSLEFVINLFSGMSLSPLEVARVPSLWDPPTVGHHSCSGP
jgi:hypothetical protein